MKQSMALNHGGDIVLNLVHVIQENRTKLSEIDGIIGDGDHGVNMNKGFTHCAQTINEQEGETMPLSKALDILALSLVEGIGGSMGPLYGSFFMTLANGLEGHDELDSTLFSQVLDDAVESVSDIGGAKVGDKSLIDVLVPAKEAFLNSVSNGESFTNALKAMSNAAEQGRENTVQLQAKIGRAARLGERSIGVPDAGATSCCLIIQSLSHDIAQKVQQA